MKIVSLNVNDFGGKENHREEYKDIYGSYSYLREWDKLDKSHHVNRILSYCGQINPKPDMIILQEFDIRSKEAVEFQRKMGELGYRMESECLTPRPSMTVFFIAQEINCVRIEKIHDRNLRAYAVETTTDNYIIYGTHIPPKYDENFWDEIDRFA